MQPEFRFYIIEPEPDLRIGKTRRIKCGISSDVWNRLNTYLTSSPKATLLGVWPCEKYRELETIAYLIEKNKLRLVRGEVFDCDDVSKLIRDAENYLSKLTMITKAKPF